MKSSKEEVGWMGGRLARVRREVKKRERASASISEARAEGARV